MELKCDNIQLQMELKCDNIQAFQMERLNIDSYSITFGIEMRQYSGVTNGTPEMRQYSGVPNGTPEYETHIQTLQMELK